MERWKDGRKEGWEKVGIGEGLPVVEVLQLVVGCFGSVEAAQDLAFTFFLFCGCGFLLYIYIKECRSMDLVECDLGLCSNIFCRFLSYFQNYDIYLTYSLEEKKLECLSFSTVLHI